MTKRQDLYLQRRSRSEQSDQRQPDQAANISHQPRASPNSTPLASRIEFPTMTAGDGHTVWPASIPAEALCRRRLSRTDLSVRRSQNPPANRRGDRQAFRYRKGLCGLAQAMDRRTHHRLAKDWECLNRKALAFLRLASIRLMLRKLCQKRA